MKKFEAAEIMTLNLVICIILFAITDGVNGICYGIIAAMFLTRIDRINHNLKKE